MGGLQNLVQQRQFIVAFGGRHGGWAGFSGRGRFNPP